MGSKHGRQQSKLIHVSVCVCCLCAHVLCCTLGMDRTEAHSTATDTYVHVYVCAHVLCACVCVCAGCASVDDSERRGRPHRPGAPGEPARPRAGRPRAPAVNAVAHRTLPSEAACTLSVSMYLYSVRCGVMWAKLPVCVGAGFGALHTKPCHAAYAARACFCGRCCAAYRGERQGCPIELKHREQIQTQTPPHPGHSPAGSGKRQLVCDNALQTRLIAAVQLGRRSMLAECRSVRNISKCCTHGSSAYCKSKYFSSSKLSVCLLSCSWLHAEPSRVPHGAFVVQQDCLSSHAALSAGIGSHCAAKGQPGPAGSNWSRQGCWWVPFRFQAGAAPPCARTLTCSRAAVYCCRSSEAQAERQERR